MNKFFEFLRSDNGRKLLRGAIIFGIISGLLSVVIYVVMTIVDPTYLQVMANTEQLTAYIEDTANASKFFIISAVSLIVGILAILVSLFATLSILNSTQEVLIEEDEEVKIFSKMFKNFGGFIGSMILYLGIPVAIGALVFSVVLKLDPMISSIIGSILTSFLTYFAYAKFFKYKELDFAVVVPIAAIELIFNVAHQLVAKIYLLSSAISIVSTIFSFIFVIYYTYQLATTNEYKYTKEEI